MYARVGLLLFVCKIIFSESHEIHPVTDYISLIHVEPTPAPATLPEGYTSYPEKHVAYKLHQEALTWEAARDRCISEGGHLAVADSHSKIQELIEYRYDEGENQFHVGIHRSNTTDEWVRVDNGLPVTNLLWLEGGPTGEPAWKRDCASLLMIWRALVNLSCDYEKKWFICEIPI